MPKITRNLKQKVYKDAEATAQMHVDNIYDWYQELPPLPKTEEEYVKQWDLREKDLARQLQAYVDFQIGPTTTWQLITHHIYQNLYEHDRCQWCSHIKTRDCKGVVTYTSMHYYNTFNLANIRMFHSKRRRGIMEDQDRRRF
jgi:hypothetical protein